MPYSDKRSQISARKLLGCLCGFLGVGLIVRLGPVRPDAATLAAALACIMAALSPGIFVGGALVLLATALVTGFNPLRRAPAADPIP